MENVERKKAQGIISFKGLFDSMEKAIDGIDTKIAENKYEKIRKELLENGINETEKDFKEFADFVEKTKHLKPYEIDEMKKRVMDGKYKAATKKRMIEYLSVIYAGAEATTVALTGNSILATVLATFGISAPPATTIVACSIAGGTMLWSLYKLSKGKNFAIAEQGLSKEEYIKECFEPLVNEVKALCDELDKTKQEDIQRLKSLNNKDKKVSSKDFRKTFAKNAIAIIDRMNLQHIRRGDVLKAYGIKEESEDGKKSAEQENSAPKQTEMEKGNKGNTMTNEEIMLLEQKERGQE